ncbi:glycosyltransferase family 2 protein [Flavobacterium limi]|uniref:Glycosyl transferase n=1 Tax=Flavobacterium limi TaxID=2045105 RepID=A0ABQ1UUL8_9FLAO|nr:glycosyltransferase family 2 protein [Flavobacterium limi]GGF25635.1 glycosyl transferase [Flavobacterium limi]
MTPYFSIIIPLYNKESYIENTLKSVFSQTFTDYEIIIINDESTDESEAIVQTLNDERIQIYSQKNQGASAARNLGIKKSKGNFIAFLDADDYWFPNHLETLQKLIQDCPNAGLYASRYISKVSEKRFVKNSFLNLSEKFSGIIPDFFYSSLVSRIALTSAVVVPKRVFDKTGFFNTSISSGQDLDLWIRIAILFPAAITGNVTVEYNAMDNRSLSKKNISKKKLIDFSVFQKEEATHPTLKAFLDVNRMDYALKFKISGNTKAAYEYYNAISKKNITLKNWIIFHLPRWIQVPLLKIKKSLYRKGIAFSVYR